MVNIVGNIVIVVDHNHPSYDVDHIFFVQDSQFLGIVKSQPFIELVAADFSQVVALMVKEEVFYQPLRILGSERVAWPQSFIDIEQSVRGISD